MAARNITGPYTIPSYRCRSHTVATNKSPIGAYRGVARRRPASPSSAPSTSGPRGRSRAVRGAHGKHGAASAMPYRSITNCTSTPVTTPSRCAAPPSSRLETVRARQKRAEADGRLIGVGFASSMSRRRMVRRMGVARRAGDPRYESATAPDERRLAHADVWHRVARQGWKLLSRRSRTRSSASTR